MLTKTWKLIYIYSVVCLLTLSSCSYILNKVQYVGENNADVIMRDSIYKFLEVFSLSNKSAIYSLKDIASDSVVTKFSSLSGNTEMRVPVPAIWTYTKLSDRKVEVVFDSKLESYTTLYRYTFEFDLNTYKIHSVKTEYLYRGASDEN